jgi:thioredoxin reductase (NADPH)
MTGQHDLIVIGGGAAGLSAAQYGARANLDTLLVEEMAPGGQALLIDGLENYPGLPQPVNGYEFAENMRSQAERFGAGFLTASVSAIRKEDGGFVLETTEGELRAAAVILATGSKHRHAGAEGEERLAGRGVSYCATCDGPFFKGKRIWVVGGGDAACDEAQFLAKLSPQVTVVHRKDRFRAQRSLAERVLANPSIKVRFNSVIKEIRGDKKVESVILRDLATGQDSEEGADAVFVFVGSIPTTGLAAAAGATLDEAGFVLTDEHMATSVPGLYAAGDVRATPFRQIVTACADGAVAAHSAAQYIDELRGQGYR